MGTQKDLNKINRTTSKAALGDKLDALIDAVNEVLTQFNLLQADVDGIATQLDALRTDVSGHVGEVTATEIGTITASALTSPEVDALT